MRKSKIYGRIAELLAVGERFTVAEIIGIKGSCPQEPGACIIVHPDKSIEFTIGGGPFEAEVIEDSVRLMTNGEAVTVKQYTLTEDGVGMFCQGVVDVLIKGHQPDPELLIFGAGHVGGALARLAAGTTLFRVTLIDDRPEYADPSKHPGVDRIILADRDYVDGVPELEPNSYAVIVTRCHPTDMALVKRYAGVDCAYLGMIGSEGKKRKIFKELLDNGEVSREALERVHTPIGIPLGGKSPDEIAVSILAQLVQVKHALGAPQE